MRSLTRKQAAMALAVVVVIAGGGLFWYFEPTRMEFHFEEWTPHA